MMQKVTALVFAVLVLGAVAVVVFPGGRRGKPASTQAFDAGPTPVADAGAEPPEPQPPPVADADAPLAEDPTGLGGPPMQADAGGTLLLSGEVPPPLPPDAPKSVIFGVILVQYKGAQSAPPNSRSRDAALEIAKQLAEEGRKDFKAAAAKGDKGSMDNAGRIPRGILEPAPEFVLFSLAKGDVSDPVDTPRGFWIVHRIE